MGDIKLFKIYDSQVSQIEGQAVAVEKSLQQLIEKHLQQFLGVRFLASEYGTGKTHGGRIDTMGIDENDCPVIIEYKRAINENVVSQGLYYLDWLLDHKGEFTLLALKKYGPEIPDEIEWNGARLICIASDFTKFDEHSIKQINRNIELIRYRRYGEELLLFDLVSTSSGQLEDQASEKDSLGKSSIKEKPSVDDKLEKAPADMRDRFEALKAFLVALGDDIQVNTLKNYFAFKRLKNFACVDIHNQTHELIVWVNLDPSSVEMLEGFTRDVTRIGHHGTGNVEITICDDADLVKAQPILIRSFDAN